LARVHTDVDRRVGAETTGHDAAQQQTARSWLATHWAGLGCAILLLLLGATLISTLPDHTITTDETVHIPAGYAYWTRHDFAPNNEHPPLAKLWATLPWLVLTPPEPPVAAAETPAKRTVNTGRYFWQLNVARMDELVFWARVPMVLLTVALGGLIFACGRRLFGARAGLLALALFCLEPTVLAHGWIVHTDIPASLAYLSWWAALAIYIVRPGWPRATLLGVATGAAIVTKYNLLVVLPFGVLALAILLIVAPRRGARRASLLAHAGIVTLLSLLILNAVYFFTHRPLTDVDIAWLRQEDPGRADQVLGIIRALAPIVPPYYQFGTYTVLTHNGDGHPAGLLGHFDQQGWWYYFPVAFALKTALPFLIVTLAAIGWSAWRIIRHRDWRPLIVLVPMLIFAASAMSSHINIGIRHFLPVFPFCFILGGALLDRLLAVRGRWPRRFDLLGVARAMIGPALVALILLGMFVGTARAYPNYLSYMNPLACCQPPWYYLSDSNIEWGEDVGALASYLHARGETTVREAIVTPETLTYMGITPLDLFAPETASAPPTRYIAIGASFLNGSVIDLTHPQNSPDSLAEYRNLTPEAVFGGSIYLFRTDSIPNPPALRAPLPDGQYRATLALREKPSQLRVGQSAALRVRATNTSTLPWPANDPANGANQIHLGDRWRAMQGDEVVLDDGRSPLTFAVLPGQTADLELLITAPAKPGTYILEIDMVQEGVAWFDARGGTPLRVTITVQP
jgi:hypothetical protein